MLIPAVDDASPAGPSPDGAVGGKEVVVGDIKIAINVYNCIYNFKRGNVTINIIKTSHDASDSVGYILKYQQKKIVYITDTGYINKRYDEILKNADIYIMESNHDVQMLQNGKYPFELRKRILGDKGHLSNEDASKYLCKYIGPKTKYIFLAHLSEENNKEEIALETLKKKLSTNQIDFNNIIVAKQNEMTKEIVIR